MDMSGEILRGGNEGNESHVIDKGRAYAGEIGRQRREFCVDYAGRKNESFRRIQRDIFAQIEAGSGSITCHKGCSHCCVLYVEADIQECEAIVYFLYQHPETMATFVRRYNAWRGRMRRLGNPFARCEEILHQHRDGRLEQSDQAMLLDALLLYQEQDIPCAFLDEGACSIYEVRPYVCANHYVTSPADWCRAVNWCDPAFPHRPVVFMTTIDEIYDRLFYHRTLDKPVIGFLPTTVYRLLTEGLEYVAHRTGLGSLLPTPLSPSRPDSDAGRNNLGSGVQEAL
jgi:Fe-S-cluster containining protein